MKNFSVLLIALILCLTSGCQRKKSICSEDSDLQTPSSIADQQPAAVVIEPASEVMKIGWKTVTFDRVVHGSFCDDAWSGTVYVACDIEIPEWEEAPTFLDDCALSIEEGTVVYVAHHNNEAFYKGCSCHFSEEILPE